jgi:hypothetical protein
LIHKQVQPRAQGYPKFEFKKTYQVDINFPVGM